MELKKYKLSEVATFEISNVDKKTKAGELSVHLCNFTDVYYNWAVTEAMEDSFMVATASDNQIKKLSLRKGQVAITKDSETRHDIGIPTYIANDFDNTVLGYHCALITPNPEMLDGRYLNAYLNSSLAKEYFANNASGSGMRYSLPVDAIKNILLYLPSIEVQREIGKIFSDIDRKIALNREINRNLEAMARQLYDYWFVQFDFPDENGKPYKSSGGKMGWDEKLKRDIPEDWKSNKISEIAKTYSGGTPTSSNKDYYDSKDVPWINSGELNESFITATDNYISEFGLNNSSAKIYPANSILVALYGATAGKVSFLSFEASSNQAVCGVIPNHANLTEYLYIALSSLCKYYISLSTGSARDNISQATVKDTLLLFPNNKILGEFHILASKIFDKIINCQLEILNLTKQRDELLPLMMSSQVSVMPSEVNCDLSE